MICVFYQAYSEGEGALSQEPAGSEGSGGASGHGQGMDQGARLGISRLTPTARLSKEQSAPPSRRSIDRLSLLSIPHLNPLCQLQRAVLGGIFHAPPGHRGPPLLDLGLEAKGLPSSLPWAPAPPSPSRGPVI